MKGDIHSFNMRYSGMPCPKRLQKYDPSLTLNNSCLVVTTAETYAALFHAVENHSPSLAVPTVVVVPAFTISISVFTVAILSITDCLDDINKHIFANILLDSLDVLL